jgi:hypothetical protein
MNEWLWFLCVLVILWGIGIAVVKIRHDIKVSKARVNMEIERAHHQSSEYWRPWTQPDYMERRRR